VPWPCVAGEVGRSTNFPFFPATKRGCGATLAFVAGDDAISFDDSTWPIIVGTCPARLSDASVAPLSAFFEKVHARKEPFCTIIDSRILRTMPSAKWRKDITAWATDPRVEADTRRYNVATAIVLESALARGVFVALGWLRKPASPTDAVSSMVEAMRWCGEKLGRAGVPLGAKAKAFQDSLIADAAAAERAPKPAR
jgi:hypothetical protein